MPICISMLLYRLLEKYGGGLMKSKSTRLRDANLKNVKVMFSSSTNERQQSRMLIYLLQFPTKEGMITFNRETVLSSVLQLEGTSPGRGYEQ